MNEDVDVRLLISVICLTVNVIYCQTVLGDVGVDSAYSENLGITPQASVEVVDREFFGQNLINLKGGVGYAKTKVFSESVCSMHKTGHLWPHQYMHVFFQYGLLNFFIYQELGVMPNWCVAGQYERFKHEISKFEFRAAAVFCKNKKYRLAASGVFYDAFCNELVFPIVRSFIQGLYNNEFLMHVGADYQMQKVRLEKMPKKIDAAWKITENNRADLLQDYCYTFVLHAVKLFKKIVLNAMAHDSNVESLTKHISTFFATYCVYLE